MYTKQTWQTGDVITAEKLNHIEEGIENSMPGDTTIPTKTSDLTNDSGFVNDSGAASAAPVQSVNGNTGAVTVPTIPSGGTAGQFLVKQSGTDYDAAWVTENTEVADPASGVVTQALDAGKIYHFTGALTALTITLTAPVTGLAQYHFDFDSGSTAPTLTMPSTVTMPDSFSVEANKHYEIDILNGYGAVIAWAIS